MCSLRFENNLLTFEGVRFSSISKKTPLSKLSFAFVSLALPLLHENTIFTYLSFLLPNFSFSLFSLLPSSWHWQHSAQFTCSWALQRRVRAAHKRVALPKPMSILHMSAFHCFQNSVYCTCASFFAIQTAFSWDTGYFFEQINNKTFLRKFSTLSS
jgi:hypothetical protein